MSEVSKLSIYSIGIVAKNKPLSSKIIEVTPIEDIPQSHGQLTDNQETHSANSTDANGSAYSTEVSTTATVKALWLPIGISNRMTPPDVRRGENVVLYRFADSDAFYWTTLMDDMRLRKLETVIYGFSGTQDEGATNNAENMYFLEVSTHRKLIHLHTSKSNGELFSYDVQINGGEGFIQIQDHLGNYFQFNSKDRIIESSNIDGSKITINKKTITLECTDSITLKTKDITFNGSKSITNNSEKIGVNGSDSITLVSPDIKLDK